MLAVALAVIVAAGRARADDVGSEPVRVAFAAPSGCPDEQAFTAELRARTARARPAWLGEPARTFRITITRHLSGTLGNLTIEEPGGGGTAVREVTGRSCAEVVSAVALITALAVDPHASTAPAPQLAPFRGSGTPDGYPGVLGPALPWYLGLPSGLAPPALRLLPPAEGEVAIAPLPLPAWVPPPLPEVRGARVTVGAHVMGHGGIGPELSPGVAVFVDVSRREPDLFAPSFRLWLMKAPGGSTLAAGQSSATLDFSAAALETCPIQFALEAFVRLFPCAALEAGAIQGQGDGPVFFANITRPWVSADFVGRSQWTLVEHLALEVQGGVGFPFIRDRFLLAPATVVYAVPKVTGTIGAGVGVRFP